MEKNRIVEVVEAFQMVRPGQVYESTIAEGEMVEGRVADVALQLDKGIERDPEAEGQADAGVSVPDAKAGLKGEVKSEDGTGK